MPPPGNIPPPPTGFEPEPQNIPAPPEGYMPENVEAMQHLAATRTAPQFPAGPSHQTGFTGQPLTPLDAALAKAHGTYGPGVPAGYFEKQMGEIQRQQLGQQLGHEPSWWDIAKSEGKNLATAGAYIASGIAAPGGSGVGGALARTATTGGLAGLTSYLQGGTPSDIAISTGFGLGMQGLGEALTSAEAATPTASKFVARLLNASGKITPETLANLQAAEPALRSMPAPAKMTPAGAAEGFRQGSRAIDSQIQAIIKPAANADVSQATAQIAQNLREQITPEMQRVNKGAANAIEKLASGIEESKTLGSLDELRQQMNDKIFSTKSNAVFRQYAQKAHSDILDAIAEHAQAIRPDMPVRSLRTQQSALMKLADTFEESGAKGQALATMKQGMSLRQRAATGAQEMVSAYLNPREALMRRLMKPGTSEGYLRSAFGGNRPATTLDIGPPPSQTPLPAPSPEMAAEFPGTLAGPAESQTAVGTTGVSGKRLIDMTQDEMNAYYRSQGVNVTPSQNVGERAAAAVTRQKPGMTGEALRAQQLATSGEMAGTSAGAEQLQGVQQAFAQAKQELGPKANLNQLAQRAEQIRRGTGEIIRPSVTKSLNFEGGPASEVAGGGVQEHFMGQKTIFPDVQSWVKSHGFEVRPHSEGGFEVAIPWTHHASGTSGIKWMRFKTLQQARNVLGY